MNTDTRGEVPLAFRLALSELSAKAVDGDFVSIRTAVRALTGMQKEALVTSPTGNSVWRMLCDEGPYLNGSDLAPPPLAYFSAGMASSLTDAIETHAGASGSQVDSLEITVDNRYTMEGSALRGTMTADALPVEISVKTDATITPDSIARAVARSPIETLMRNSLNNTISVTHNGANSAQGKPGDPMPLFENLQRPADSKSRIDTVTKLESTESVFDTNHGAGAAMKAQQKRELHIRSILNTRSDGLRDIRVQIFKPIGSVFAFVCEPAHGTDRAPNGLQLVSAGIAFCFMTQIGRYAGITKKRISEYAAVQDTLFGLGTGHCGSIDTCAFINSPEPMETVQEIVAMAEQTCFLHAACRANNESRILI